ncbi:hypothetical protein [Hydrocarboniphaga effusa]|jgi:hypothetical protein|uniref:hypothetical protein n=1 Tax=Hydrocarboniphaga effusa TaxID=243629 RepID=UPI0031380913
MSIEAGAPRIIPAFLRRVGLGLALIAAAGAAQAQAGYQLQVAIDLEGQKYEVPMSPLRLGDRVEVPVTPAGLRAYARVIPLQGMDGQAMLDLQVYEPAGGNNQKQLASVTIPSFLGTQNSAELATPKGKLLIEAYLDRADGPQPASPVAVPAQPPAPAFSAPKNFDQSLSAPKPLGPQQ